MEDNKKIRKLERTKPAIKEYEEAVKITVSKASIEALAEIVSRVNGGFDAGRVHRQEVASWIITKFRAECTESDITQIRQTHYDDFAMFEAMFRRAKETGSMPDFLKEALRRQYLSATESQKRPKKQLTRDHITDVTVVEEEAA